MRPALRAILSVAVGFFVGFGLALLFTSDPTGPPPVLLALGFTAILTPLLYRSIGRRTAETRQST